MSDKNNTFRAGSLEFVDGYQAYIPNPININFSFSDNKTLALLEEASIALSRLNTFVNGVTFTNLFTNAFLHLEALRSSEIEGTRTDLKEILLTEDKRQKSEEGQKIYNLFKTTYSYYLEAESQKDIATVKTLEDINGALFKHVPSKMKGTGKIRNCQNYIGGLSEKSALFVPPPPEKVKPLLEDLNNFWKNENFYLPNLIKIAIYHYQLETIHPFIDGNGRTGRLLINLQLKNKKLLDYPVLCLSDYWQRNKGLYYEALSIVRYSHNIEYWVRFFLESIVNTCDERIDLISRILALQSKYENLIEKSFKNTSNYKKILEYLLETTPYISVNEAKDILGLSYQRVNKIIDDLVKIGLLSIETSYKRNRVFVLKEYYQLIFKDFKNIS